MFRGDGNKVSVLTTIEVGPEVSLTQSGETYKGRVELSVVATDLDGRIVASATPGIDLNLRPTTRDAVSQHGLRTTSRVELKPGRYQIRIAARDPNSGKAGSVIHDLRVPDFRKPPVAMSDLVVASAGATRVATINVDSQLQGVLTVPPTTSRQFAPSDTITVIGEVYDNRKNDIRPLRVTTSVADASGTVVYRSEEPIESFAFEPTRRSYRHRISIPLRGVAPGEYVLKVVVTGSGDAPVTREVAIAVQDDTRVALNTTSGPR
jgi:hypothetical protein